MFKTLYNNFVFLLQQRPALFVSIWVFLFAGLSLLLISLGIAPAVVLGEDDEDPSVVLSEVERKEMPTIVDTTHADEAVSPDASAASAPVRIIIDAIDVDTQINNPTNTDIETLDAALLTGAVHYPGSGNLEDTSNMFLFGHSSRLPIVQNQAFKAFNGLEDLKEGDLIRVQSATKEYHYRVESVDEVKAEDAWVTFDSDEKKLTLSTCNNFGSKQDRFVVEADFVGSFVLGT